MAQLRAALCPVRITRNDTYCRSTSNPSTLFPRDGSGSGRKKSRKILESRTGRDTPGVGRGLECARLIALAQATANLRCPAAHQPSASTARCPAVTNAGRPRGQRRGTQRPGCTSAAAPGHCGTARKQRGNTARGGLRAEGCARRPRRRDSEIRRAHTARPEASPAHAEERRTGSAARRAHGSPDPRTRAAVRPTLRAALGSPRPGCGTQPPPHRAGPRRGPTRPGGRRAGSGSSARGREPLRPRPPFSPAAPTAAAPHGPALPRPTPIPAPGSPQKMQVSGGSAAPGAAQKFRGRRRAGSRGRRPGAGRAGPGAAGTARHGSARLTSFWRGSCG